MKPERILLPIDVAKCPLEVFQVVNGFVERPGVTVILLHVVPLRILAPENRIYDELGREAQSCLHQLARKCVHPMAAARIRVRVGEPAREILTEAREANADLIILPVHRVPFWKRLCGSFFPRTIERVIREAPCGVFVMDVKTCLHRESERDQREEKEDTTEFAAGISRMRRAWGLPAKGFSQRAH
jgi:nucleotide-binding universal stress UspA family protein